MAKGRTIAARPGKTIPVLGINFQPALFIGARIILIARIGILGFGIYSLVSGFAALIAGFINILASATGLIRFTSPNMTCTFLFPGTGGHIALH